jgi:hypothetical protein
MPHECHRRVPEASKKYGREGKRQNLGVMIIAEKSSQEGQAVQQVFGARKKAGVLAVGVAGAVP